MSKHSGLSNIDPAGAAAEAEARYVAANPESRRRHEAAAAHMPGGNTRTVLFYSPYPVVLNGGEGCRVRDVDGHVYADYLGEYTAGLYGHSHPVLQAALHKAVDDGFVLGGHNIYEAELAAEMCRRFPSLERVRFCNSGTEANLFAISAARLHTGRQAVLVFHGAYHGGVFYFGQQKSPINAPFPWVLGHYNDIDSTLALLDKRAPELAAVLIEPMMGAAGGIPADPEFLRAIRAACSRLGILLIFDEVMTSRLSSGGLQKRLGVAPDLTSFGKYLGGGANFGAFGGRADIMDRFDPRRPDAVGHAGTFNNNVFSMAAGLAGLTQIYTDAAAEKLTADGDRLRERLSGLAVKHKLPLQFLGVGSIMGIHFHGGPIRRPQDLWPSDAAQAARIADLQKLMHLELLEQGQYLARRGFVSLSLPMTEADHDRFCGAMDEFMSIRAPLIAAVGD
jgi:glutamate-1-semialdehyde 2,1-aminomutase